MNTRQAYDIIAASRNDAGRFYGPAADLSIGVGLFLDHVAFPQYSIEEEEYVIVDGLVYVMTHECDIDPVNLRPFNDHVVLCPVIPLSEAVRSYCENFNDLQAASFFDALGKDDVERAIYIPPIADVLPEGGLMYFGFITSTGLSNLLSDGVQRCIALSAHGLMIVDQALERVFRRPKAERLALS